MSDSKSTKEFLQNESFKSTLNLEKEQSNGDLDQSFDHLLPKSESTQQYQNNLQKSYLPEDQNKLLNQNNNHEEQQQNEQPQQNELQDNGILSKFKSVFSRSIDRLKSLVIEQKRINDQKQPIQLLGESAIYGFTSIALGYLGDMYSYDEEKIIQSLKRIVHNINEIKQKSFVLAMKTKESDDMILYGQVFSKNNDQVNNNNNQIGYQMHYINLKYHESDLNKQYEFPLVKSQHLHKKVRILNDSDVVVKNNNSTLSKELLLVPFLGKTIQLCFDSQNQTIVVPGNNVFILAKKLANSSILPKVIFKDFDLSKIESKLRLLKIKKILFGFVGVSLLALSGYQFYKYLKKRFNNIKKTYHIQHKNGSTTTIEFEINL